MSLVRVEEIISDRGKIILDKIFSSYITVVEKLSGSSFYMKNTNECKYFYRQSINNPINLVDRTLNKLWNEPLAYLERFDSLGLPDNWTFKFEWFYSDAPQGLQYARRPKNGLVLTGIWDQKDNLVTELYEYENYNTLFQIESIPLLWEGTLSEDQKTSITKFTTTPHESLIKEFGTDSFIRHFLNVLNPSIKGCLQENSSAPIEGVVIKFNDNSIEDLILIDQVFEDITKQVKFNRSREPKTIYSLILVDILHWLNETSALSSIVLRGNQPDSRYLNLIVDLWKLFVKENGERYLELDFQLPNELKDNAFRLNTSFINDPVALKLLEDNVEYENLLQIFLAGFRKKKKKSIGLLTTDLLNDFNQVVDKIKTKILSIYESQIPTYQEFKMMQSIMEDDMIEDPIRDEVIEEDPEVGVQPIIEPKVEEVPEVVTPTVNLVSSIDPVLVELRKFSDVIVCYNQRVPSKLLLNAVSESSNFTDKKVIIFSPNKDEIKNIVLTKFSNDYSSLVKELITDDLSWEVILKKYPVSDIYVDPIDFDWINLIVKSLDIKIEIHNISLYNSMVEESITENDFVKFKQSVPETTESDWLTIISLKNDNKL